MRSLTVRQLLQDIDVAESVFTGWFYLTEIGRVQYAYVSVSELFKRIKDLTLLDEKQGIILFHDTKYRIADYSDAVIYVPIKEEYSIYGNSIHIWKELPCLLNVGNCFQFVD